MYGLRPPDPLGWINEPPIFKVRAQSQLLEALRVIEAAVLDVKADFKANIELRKVADPALSGNGKDSDYKFAISDRKEILGLMLATGADELTSGGGSRQAFIYRVTGVPAAVAVVESKADHMYVWTLLSHPYFAGATVVMIEYLLNLQVKRGRGACILLLPLNDRTRALYASIGFKNALHWEMEFNPKDHPDRWGLVDGKWRDKRDGGYLDSIDLGALKGTKEGG